MDQITLGRTGITTSVVGLGAGGPSRIGKSLGISENESVALVTRAYDLGITFFDSAEAYGTEEYIGKGLAGVPADKVCISTKLSCRVDGRIKTPAQLEKSLDASLERLNRDWVDIYHLHGIMPNEYPEISQKLHPVLERMKEKGKIRFIGITEMFGQDSGHRMLDMALTDDLWDVVMVGFSAINFSARSLFQRTRDQGVGVLDMFAVRRSLRDLATIQERIQGFISEGILDPEAASRERPFAYALESGACETVPELSYRFCRHDPGIDIVLSGTSSLDHLEQNVKAMSLPPLPQEVARRLDAVFGGVDSISGNN